MKCRATLQGLLRIPGTLGIAFLIAWVMLEETGKPIPLRETAAAMDMPAPSLDITLACVRIEALMHLDQTEQIAAATLQALSQWPDDSRLLEPLFFMTLKEPATWENHYRDHLRRILPSIGSHDALFQIMRKCFEITRPDLAWTVYRRMGQIDPKHPAMTLAAAEFGDRWFTFRRHALGLPAASQRETIDIKPFFTLGRVFPGLTSGIPDIPLGDVLAVRDPTPVRKTFLNDALDAFATHPKGKSVESRYLHAMALERSGRSDLAHEKINTIMREHPTEGARARLSHASIYHRKGDWVNVYETLRGVTKLPLAAWLLMAQAQLNLNMPSAARVTADAAQRHDPESPHASALLAAILLQHGDAEDALRLLRAPRKRSLRALDILEAEALFATDRFPALDAFCKGHLLPPPRTSPLAPHPSPLAPAELCLLKHITHIPPDAVFAEAATAIRQNLNSASPGMRPLLELWITGYETHCTGESGSPLRWIATGRDRQETAIALYQLALLHCRDGRIAEAAEAVRMSTAYRPESPVPWQLLISLAPGNTADLRLARAACPDDADLWLAAIVANTHPEVLASKPDAEARKPQREQVELLIDEALATDSRIHSLARCRAADYLWRLGWRDQASRISTGITQDTELAHPAYRIGLRDALYRNDIDQALREVTLAIQTAPEPAPELYETLVLLRTRTGAMGTDAALVNALRMLRTTDPGNTAWAQMLGTIRYQRGGGEELDALSEMNAAIEGGATNLLPFLIAADVSRMLRNYQHAAETLRQGLHHHPGSLALRNNLAYLLAHQPTTLPEALTLIPELENASDPHILDTLAFIHLQAGDLAEAHQVILRSLASAEPGTRFWFRSQMHRAEIAWRKGDEQTAASMLGQLLKSSHNIPNEDILSANALFNRITTTPTPPLPIQENNP